MELSILKEITTGLIGGALASLMIFLIKWLNRKRIQRKYALSGYYFSKFQDGGEEYTNAKVRIKQNGFKVSGTEIHSDGREWNLNGQLIKDTGHIVGSYAADAFYDEGVGSFYLKVEKNQLVGIWTGYANQIKDIKSGKYVLRKTNKQKWNETT